MMLAGDVVSRRQRFVVLDFYRYVAAVGVVLFHVQTSNQGIHLSGVGSFGLFVDMFFILSGFVIAYNYQNKVQTWFAYRAFLGKRLARIYPLHLIVLVLFASVEIALGSGSSVHLREFTINALLIQAWGFSTNLTFNTPAWSISAELACYLAFPVLALLIFRINIFMCFALIALGYILGNHGHLPIWDNAHSQMLGATYDFGLFRGLMGFINGIALCKLSSMVTARRIFLPIGIGALLLSIVLMNIFAKGDLVVLIMALAVVTTALGESAIRLNSSMSAILEWFGNTSYAIYMLHWAVVFGVATPVVERWSLSGSYLFACLVITISVLTVVSRFVFQIIEAPARRWLTTTFIQPKQTFNLPPRNAI